MHFNDDICPAIHILVLFLSLLVIFFSLLFSVFSERMKLQKKKNDLIIFHLWFELIVDDYLDSLFVSCVYSLL